MAFDEYCLENIIYDEPYFFFWQNSPSVIMGANQNIYKEVDLEYLEKNNINLVRRFSGGGAVFHDEGNVNFTFIGKYTNEKEVFEQYIGYIIDALKKLGLQNVEMTGRNDILLDGKKISGCAKRIAGDRCMVHGTLLFNVNTEALKNVLNGPKSKLRLRGTESVSKQVTNIKDYLPNIKDVKQFTQELSRILSDDFKNEIEISNVQKEKVLQISKEKYASKTWIYGKIAESNISYENKFACGTVEVELMINDNKIKEIQFNGDFIGNKNIKELESKLLGQVYTYSNIFNIIDASQAYRYLDKITTKELTDFVMGSSATN